jgi:Uma2 family endonuclease
MTPDEFFEWQKSQDQNYELVDGVPVLPLKAMTGATRRHDGVTVNATVSLANQLRGGPCRPHTDDIAVRIPGGAVRRPDMTVDCGPPVDISIEAQEPRLVLEVLSPSTMGVDRFRKLEEYKSHPSIQLILLAETRLAKVGVWRRHGDAWQPEDYQGLEQEIDLSEIGAVLPLRDLYDGLTFDQ